MTPWHRSFLNKLERRSLLSPSELARAVVGNGGTASRQVAWKWLQGGLCSPGNLLPICEAIGLVPSSNEESVFIRSWAAAHNEQMRNNESERLRSSGGDWSKAVEALSAYNG